MRTAVLATSLGLALTSIAAASPADTAALPSTQALGHAPVLPPGTTFRRMCSDHSCKALVAVDAAGHRLVSNNPIGYGPPDLQAAYKIDPSLGDGVTVAVVDAYGYAALESDLAFYRSHYGLPACTVASGCLTIVNDNGLTSPLPADDPEWIGETALDVDMVSAACPKCKIVVVQAGAAGVAGLQIGQLAAAKLGVNVISDSWGGPEDGSESSSEGDYNNPGIGTFVASGDFGYDAPGQGLTGPDYPSTSAFTIAVGGTHLGPNTSDPRGWTETAWTQAGSSCSTHIPKQPWAPASAVCSMRATSDISAVGDPSSPLATYIAGQGGWTPVGGTSAAAPLSAAIFAAAGHGDATAAFVYKHATIFNDVTSGGSNGSCGSNVCTPGPGWDGPTGLGTLDQSKIKAIGNMAGAGPTIAITFPSDGATVMPSFTIQVTPGSGTNYVEIDVDGKKVQALNQAPYQFSAPSTLADGAHAITAIAYDVDHNSQMTAINVTQSASSGSDGGNGGGGGCAAGGTGAGAGLLLAVGAALTARRRRA